LLSVLVALEKLHVYFREIAHYGLSIHKRSTQNFTKEIITIYFLFCQEEIKIMDNYHEINNEINFLEIRTRFG